MKTLIVEDEFVSRYLLTEILSKFGRCDAAINGLEAIEFFKSSIKKKETYELICLDIMMPEMDGHAVLEKIRRIEKENGITGLLGVKVIMTTGLTDAKNIVSAFKNQCEAYIIKPIDKQKLLSNIKKLGLLTDEQIFDSEE